MALASMSFQVLPLVDAPRQRVYEIVDRVIASIEEAGLSYEVGPMETTVDGEIDQLFDILRRAQEICHEEGVKTVLSYVKLVTSPDGVVPYYEKTSKYRRAGR